MLTFTRNAAWLAAAAWIGMVVARGQFWDARADRLAERPSDTDGAPDVHAVIPARNEGDVIARTADLGDRAALCRAADVTVVDDRSEDDTAAVVAAVATRRRRGA